MFQEAAIGASPMQVTKFQAAVHQPSLEETITKIHNKELPNYSDMQNIPKVRY